MVSRHNRRARVLAVALLVALMLPTTLASADYWRDQRDFNIAHNGYFITESARTTIDGADIAQVFRNSANKWRTAALSVRAFTLHANMVEFEGLIGGVDKYHCFPAYRLSGRGQYVLGLTRPKGTTSDPEVTQLEAIYPDSVNGNNKHGNGCYCDRRWNHTVVTLYVAGIRKNAAGFEVPFSQSATATAVHEIGHSLKMAHAPVGDAPGGGTENRNDRPRTGEASIMKDGDQFPVIVDLQAYDVRQLRMKWGNR